MTKRVCLMAVFAALAGCGDDLGAKITATEALRRQQVAADARAMAFTGCTAPRLSQSSTGSGQCSESDVSACVARIAAAPDCAAIETAYTACPVRCIQ